MVKTAYWLESALAASTELPLPFQETVTHWDHRPSGRRASESSYGEFQAPRDHLCTHTSSGALPRGTASDWIRRHPCTLARTLLDHVAHVHQSAADDTHSESQLHLTAQILQTKPWTWKCQTWIQYALVNAIICHLSSPRSVMTFISKILRHWRLRENNRLRIFEISCFLVYYLVQQATMPKWRCRNNSINQTTIVHALVVQKMLRILKGSQQFTGFTVDDITCMYIS